MEINDKYHKSNKISKWKGYGVIHDDFSSLYDTYINTFNCQHCGKEFKNVNDRHLDHDHKTGLFRLIVCQSCNNHDSYIKYPDGYSKELYYERTRDKQLERARLHYEDNKDKKLEYQKEYNESNNEKITEYKKQHYEKNKEKINKKNRENHHKNKEHNNAKSKEYHEANKDRINAKKKEKVTCGCGVVYTYNHRARHFKSKRHVDYEDKE